MGDMEKNEDIRGSERGGKGIEREEGEEMESGGMRGGVTQWRKTGDTETETEGVEGKGQETERQ